MKIGRLAAWYRWIEYAAFGGALERRRFAFLPRLAHCRQVLVIGEGDGRSLARLLAAAPAAHCDVVEVSPEMIALARERAGSSERVTFRCQDALLMEWQPHRYNAIVTNFFLDCFREEDARHLVRSLAGTLKPGGIWLIGEFAIPEKGWRRLHAQMWIWTMYRFFGLTTGLKATSLPPIETLMRDAGMQRMEMEQARAGMMVSEIWIKQPLGAWPQTSL